MEKLCTKTETVFANLSGAILQDFVCMVSLKLGMRSKEPRYITTQISHLLLNRSLFLVFFRCLLQSELPVCILTHAFVASSSSA